MVQGARRDVLRTEQRLLGGGLPGYLFGVLGRKAWVTPRAVGGCDGHGAISPLAVRLVSRLCSVFIYHNIKRIQITVTALKYVNY